MEHGVLRGNRPTPASPWVLLGVPQWSSGYFKATDPRASYVSPPPVCHEASVPHSNASDVFAQHFTQFATTAQAVSARTASNAKMTGKCEAGRWNYVSFPTCSHAYLQHMQLPSGFGTSTMILPALLLKCNDREPVLIMYSDIQKRAACCLTSSCRGVAWPKSKCL